MLIIDMPMPKCCARCFLADENDRCSILGTVATQKGRMPNCPIKGVLPDEHGDLNDRDELLKECYPDDEFDAHVIYADDIQKAKAAIAAERKESV